MSRTLKLIGLAIFALALVAGLYGYRSLMLFDGRTPESYKLLTAIPGSSGFEPKTMPNGPVLTNRSPRGFAVDFGYRVGDVPYSYSLELSFPEGSSTGKATFGARHASRGASIETEVTRRWDEPRKAYAVALQGKLDIEPAVPALCIKAVIGPRLDTYDLDGATICVAQRDVSGACHPKTLACGLIRK